jgi:hypothetical protein
MAPETVDQVRAVAQANPTLLTSSTITTGEESSTTVGADVAGFGLEFEKGGSMTEAVTTAPEGVTKRLTATATSGVTAKAPVGPKVTSRQVETFDAKIGPDAKATAEASTRRSDTDLGATAEALRTAPIATLTGAVTGKTSLLKERSETSGTKVDDDDFQRLTGLAADATAWERSFLNGEGMVNDAFGEWRATRSRVLAANSNREEISRALAEFQRGGPRRSGVIQAAYRMAGAGIRFDFPQVLERQRSVYDELVVGSPITGIRALSDVGRRQEAADRATTVTTRLNDLQSAIIARQAEVSDPGVLSEMLRRVGTRISQVNAEARTLKKAATPQVGTGGPAASQPPTADTEAVKEDAAVTIRTTTATLGSLQEREKAIMDFVDSEYGHWYRKSDAIVISKKLGALREMYSQWRLELERLRTAYAAHGDAPTAADKYAPNQSRYDAQYKRFQVW